MQGLWNEKVDRFWRLSAKIESEYRAGGSPTQLELNEQAQLFYELHPDSQFWRCDYPHMTPEDYFHARANGSTVAG